jgi:hypothetical protein
MCAFRQVHRGRDPEIQTSYFGFQGASGRPLLMANLLFLGVASLVISPRT